MEARPVVDVVCALLQSGDGRLLLAKRPAGKHLAGFWEFPGGKIEPGESPETALQRELHEELGCVVAAGDALTPVLHAYENITVRLRPFLARLTLGSPAPQAREHEAVGWFTAAEISGLALPAADAPIVAEWIALRAPGVGPT